jgi:anti-anti-sigma factor
MEASLGMQNSGGLNRGKELSHSQRRGPGLLRIQGELDDHKARFVKERIERMKRKGVRNIMIDMEGVRSVTLLGIGMLGDFLSGMGVDGDEIGISGLEKRLRSLFSRFGYPGILSQCTG